LEPSRMASERLAALHRHLAEETARLLGWEAGQEVAARDREARILYLEQQASLQASNAALRAELADAGQRREELKLRVAHIRREIDELEEHRTAVCGEAARRHFSARILAAEEQVAAFRAELADARQRREELDEHLKEVWLAGWLAERAALAEETARLPGWEAGQEVAARVREARILHLEQLEAEAELAEVEEYLEAEASNTGGLGGAAAGDQE